MAKSKPLMLGLWQRKEAPECGGELKLDLVEVQRTANPPVCKLMDFHGEKYKKQLKEKDRAKSKDPTVKANTQWQQKKKSSDAEIESDDDYGIEEHELDIESKRLQVEAEALKMDCKRMELEN
ncbi:hypothetical protein ACB092_07G188200 [Castanea dentata]